jgi:cytochrome c6
MLDKGKCVSSGNFNASAGREKWFQRMARVGTVAMGLAVMMALALTASAARAGANNAAADDVGAKTFKSTCVTCHGDDGTGTPAGKALKAPDLHDDVVQKLTDAQIAEQISNGKNNMPPFKNTLTKDQVQALVKYVRTFRKKK